MIAPAQDSDGGSEKSGVMGVADDASEGMSEMGVPADDNSS